MKKTNSRDRDSAGKGNISSKNVDKYLAGVPSPPAAL
jgi:hypothetical protein